MNKLWCIHDNSIHLNLITLFNVYYESFKYNIISIHSDLLQTYMHY